MNAKCDACLVCVCGGGGAGDDDKWPSLLPPPLLCQGKINQPVSRLTPSTCSVTSDCKHPHSCLCVCVRVRAVFLSLCQPLHPCRRAFVPPSDLLLLLLCRLFEPFTHRQRLHRLKNYFCSTFHCLIIPHFASDSGRNEPPRDLSMRLWF